MSFADLFVKYYSCPESLVADDLVKEMACFLLVSVSQLV